VGAAAPPYETDFMLLSSDFSPKYCIFIVTAPPFCLTAPTFKNSWIRHWFRTPKKIIRDSLYLFFLIVEIVDFFFENIYENIYTDLLFFQIGHDPY
jgi:hypothetical protein